MTFSVTFVVDDSVLKSIISGMEDKAYEGLVSTAERITTDAKNNAPYRTGALSESIVYEIPSGEGNELEAQIHDGVTYGVFQELGTSRMAAQPFLYPAVDANLDEFRNALKELFE